jgi:TrmH family RNA methyltransferase
VHPTITSTQNPKIRQLAALEKSRERRRQGLFLVEGLREIAHALRTGYEVVSIFYPEHGFDTLVDALPEQPHEEWLIPVSKGIFEKITYRSQTAGALALMRTRSLGLKSLEVAAVPLILVVESVEKPGNLGALLRTADAAGVDAVIVCDALADPYNPNVVRSSVGALFTCQIAVSTSDEAIAWLNERNIPVYTTHLQAAVPYYQPDYRKGAALVLGTEATGVSDAWVSASAQSVIIPMYGRVDSMNVSAAAAVVIFEAVRQRKASNAG